MRCPLWSEHEGFYDRFDHHKDHLIIHFVFKVKNDSLFLRYNQCTGRILNFQGHRTYNIYRGGGVEGGGALKTCAINYTTYLKKQTQTSNA